MRDSLEIPYPPLEMAIRLQEGPDDCSLYLIIRLLFCKSGSGCLPLLLHLLTNISASKVLHRNKLEFRLFLQISHMFLRSCTDMSTNAFSQNTKLMQAWLAKLLNLLVTCEIEEQLDC